ncbi:hypothetical protein [Flavobacterium aquidurense]|uniref:hypothetical protein n=1 Tax=Flavobacterium aquidurense TaxID=362413 RepID=UPI00285DA891|nr:hypothetical protein [Flavobacterium aquidurense]MDR7370164.1 hypothetical protein [Flavobacterium aquidurense]
MYHLNQSFEEILSLITTLIFFFFVSVGVSFFFLKLNYKTEKNSFTKALLPNLVFFSFSFILYLISIYKNTNISVFSRNEKSESAIISIILIFALIVLSIFEISIYRITFKIKPIKKYFFLLFSLNLFSYSFIFFSFYPRSYVDENILSYNRYLYKPNKKELKLFDNSIVKIDFACSSEHNYKLEHKDSIFYFRIPITQIGTDRILYSFKLLNNSKQVYSSEKEDNCETISVNKLENEIKVLFIQTNPNQDIGGLKQIVTDTIVFKKIKTEKRKAGYYGDTNCDCIER